MSRTGRLDLRTRLLAAIGLVAVLQIAVAILVISATRGHLVGQIDERLAVATSHDRGPRFDRPSPRDGGEVSPASRRLERLGDTYEGVLTADGRLLTFFAPNDTGVERPPPDIDLAGARAAQAEPITVGAVESDLRYRLAAADAGGGEVLVTAIPLDGVDATMSQLTTVVALTAGAIGLALALVAWWVLRLGIDPVKRMTATAEAIAAGDLSERITDVDPRTEAGQLGQALNTMLGRIETSFDERARAEEKLRRFIADASHELRTPIATISGYAELYRAGGLEDRAELDDAMRRTEQESRRMARLITDLLGLARLDRSPTLETRPVDLATLARDTVADAQATHRDRVVTLTAPDGGLAVEGDEDLLRQVLANLVANALVHTEAPAAVTVTVRPDDATAVIEVVDDGQGMEPGVASRVTERFFRADPSRSRHRGGSGLGLAIVESIVVAHDGRLRIDSAPGEGTRVTVTLPRSAPTDPANPDPAKTGSAKTG